MAGIRRFVTYIYEYQNGTRNRNTGFTRIEIRGAEYRIELHLRGLSCKRGEYEICFFMDAEGKRQLFPIGKVSVLNGSGDYAALLRQEQFQAYGHAFEEMDGLVVEKELEQICLTRWTDRESLEEVMQIERWIPISEREKAEKRKGEEKETESTQQKNDKKMWKREETERAEEMEEADPPEDIQATEMTARNIFPQFIWEDLWNRLHQSCPSFSLHGEKESECIRIELKDLKELPGKYWYLGNNSFLLHGFFNYRYLVLGKTKSGEYFIGIPGIYQRQEHVMAAIFGFPEFLAFEEEGKQNYFGYWYQILEQ